MALRVPCKQGWWLKVHFLAVILGSGDMFSSRTPEVKHLWGTTQTTQCPPGGLQPPVLRKSGTVDHIITTVAEGFGENPNCKQILTSVANAAGILKAVYLFI